MSDQSDPHGLPSFGRIKKLGDQNQPEPLEDIPEESDYIPEQEYYDPEDFNQSAPPMPENVPPPPAPTNRPSPLRLKRDTPDPAPAPVEEPRSLLDRTSVHEEYQQRAEKTQARFDEYFEQENRKDSIFTKIFGNTDIFPEKTRKIFMITAIVLAVLGLVFSLSTILLNLFFAAVSFQAIRVFSMQKGFLEKFGLFPGRVILTLAFSILFIFIPLFYKWWQEQGGSYIENLQHVEDVANQSQKKVQEAVAEVEKHAGDYVDSSAVATHDVQYSGKMANSFHEKTYLSGGGLFRLYVQYVFFLTALLLLPFIKENDFSKVVPLRHDNEELQWKVSRYFMTRLIKAAIISLVFIIGLNMAGAKNVFFIVGTTFILTIIMRFGPVVGLAMCLPVVITQFQTGNNGLKALITLAVTGLIALLAEKRLHWLMIVIPKSQREGFVPPAITSNPKQVVKVEGGGGGMLWSLLSLAFTLAFYGAIGFAGYKAYNIWTEVDTMQKQVDKYMKKLPENKSSILVKLGEYHEKYPADRNLISTLAKAHYKSNDMAGALEYANKFYDFKESEVGGDSLMSKAENHVRSFLTKSTKNHNDKEVHLWLVTNFSKDHPKLLGSERFLNFVNALKKIDDQDLEVYKGLGRYYYMNENFEECRAICEEGLKIDAKSVRLLCLIVRTYLDQGDKEKALKALINVDKVTTEDEEADELRKLVLRL